MDAQPPSCQANGRRLPAGADQPEGVEISPDPNGLDERNLVQLLSRPTLTTCIYRAKDCVTLALERISVMLPMLLPAALLPIMLAIVYIYAVSEVKPSPVVLSDQAAADDNERRLMFVFLVMACCSSLVFFTIAVDYTKVIRIVKDSEKDSPAGDNGSTRNSLTSQMMKTQSLLKYVLSNSELHEQKESSIDYGTTSQTFRDVDTQVSSVLANRNADTSNLLLSSLLTDEPPEMNWWETYALLRMNLHSMIYMIKQSTGTFVEGLISKQTLAVRRLRKLASRQHHFLLQSILSDTVGILILGFLIISALVSLTMVKQVRPFGGSFRSYWIVDCLLMTYTMAFFLLLHFITLLLVACLVSTAQSHISVTGLLGRWLLTLTMCIVLQCAIMPRMAHLSGCLITSRKSEETGLFSIFANIDLISDSPFVISMGDSKPTVLMLLNSLVTAIVASVLYQMNLFQIILGSIGTLFKSLLNLSPVEGLVLVLSLFGTQINLLMLVMPFLGKLSESELFSILVIMLVRTPCESDQFWLYKPPSKLTNSLTRDALLTYMPQRTVMRTLLSFPLIILFSRIIYPTTGKFGTRSSIFRRMRSMDCGRPFGSMWESLLYFVAHCLRSSCRFLVIVAFVNCIDFMLRFLVGAFQSSQATETDLVFSSARLHMLAVPMSILIDAIEVLPSNTQSLSYYVAQRFINPTDSLQKLFINSRLTKRKNTIDPFMLVFDSITTPAKEVVMSGSLTWHTLAMYVAFTVDCLHENRRCKTGFIVRGCIASWLVYSAMYNLLYLACDPRMLQHFDNIGRVWTAALQQYAENPVAMNCTEEFDY